MHLRAVLREPNEPGDPISSRGKEQRRKCLEYFPGRTNVHFNGYSYVRTYIFPCSWNAACPKNTRVPGLNGMALLHRPRRPGSPNFRFLNWRQTRKVEGTEQTTEYPHNLAVCMHACMQGLKTVRLDGWMDQSKSDILMPKQVQACTA